MNLGKKLAVVTGTGSGLGLAICKALSAAGTRQIQKYNTPQAP
jgi:NAD(P)-dependent dehydrogenase (short-subunit alcohol dehydrogenase family)